VHDWLRDNRKGEWVLILDNVDDAGFLLEAQSASRDGEMSDIEGRNSRPLISYLPQCQNGTILITTRTKVTALQLVEEYNMIAVEPMEKPHAVALLEKKLGMQRDSDDNGNKNDINELVSALEYMPLAIVQAAAYISQRAPRCAVRQYLDEFRKSDYEKTSLLDNKAGHLRRDREAKNSIIITWHISFEHIRQSRPSAADLLSLMSLFDRQGIPEGLVRNRVEIESPCQFKQKNQQKTRSRGIQRLARPFHRNRGRHEGQERDEKSSGRIDEFEDDLLTLRNYAFVSISEVQSSFEMHALVQLAMRTWLEASGQLERWRQHYCKMLCTEFPTGEYENWAKCQELFPHAQSAVAQQPEEQGSLRDWASIQHKAAWYSWRMGNGVEAEKMSVRAMKVRKRILGLEHNDTLWSMAMVGLAYKLRGRWDAAEELELQVMETSKTKLGADHPDTLTSMTNLALTYRNQGRWDAAEELQLQVMETSKTKLGADHPNTLTCMTNLALTYKNQGRWDAAEELQLQVMETRKTKLGVDHPSTLISMNNLAFTWKGTGRETEAVKLMEECIQSCKLVLGPNHPNTLSSCKALVAWKAEQDDVVLSVQSTEDE
jgi:hypothetical protein